MFKQLLYFLAAVWLALCATPSGTSAEDLTVEQALELLEGALQNIKSFDVKLDVQTTFFIHEEYAEQPGTATAPLAPPVLLKSTRLPLGQRKVERRSYRQVFSQGKGRIEYLDPATGKATVYEVYDRETAKVWNVASGAMSIRLPDRSVGNLGDDYLDAFRDLYSRLTILRGLRERKDTTVKAGGAEPPSVILETGPDQNGLIVYENMGFRVTLDPGHGFMPSRIERSEIVRGKPFLYDERIVAGWKDLGRGVWVPIKVITKSYDPDDKGTFGELFSESVTTIDPARSSWNTAIPEETFQLAVPAGVKVHDRQRRVLYVTGKPDPGKNLDDLAANARDTVAVLPIVPPEPAARWWASWPVYVLAGLLAAGLVGLTAWRLRHRRVGHPT